MPQDQLIQTDGSAEEVVILENDIRMPPLESDASSSEFSNGIRLNFMLWPGGVVPYELADSIKNRTKHIEVLFEAMKIWERVTCVKFVKRTTESRYAIIYYGSSGYVTGKYLSNAFKFHLYA